MMDREQRVRERAYMIWVSEGRPEGCEDEHWHRAVREMEQEDAEPAMDASNEGAGTAASTDGSEAQPEAAPAKTTPQRKRAPKAAAKPAATKPATPRAAKGKTGKAAG